MPRPNFIVIEVLVSSIVTSFTDDPIACYAVIILNSPTTKRKEKTAHLLVYMI